MSTGGALAQPKPAAAPQAAQPPAQPPPLKQMALTDKQIEGVIAASKDMDAITQKLPQNAKPDPKVTAQLEAVAKKNGFASYDDYNNVVDNIGLVMAGFDSTTKKYVGTQAVLKAQIAEDDADVQRCQRQRHGQPAVLCLHGGEHSGGVLQNEGADDDGRRLKQRMMASPNKQRGDRIAEHCLCVSAPRSHCVRPRLRGGRPLSVRD